MVITHLFHKNSMSTPRSFLLFENSIKSESTRKTYVYHLNKFMTFAQVDDFDSLASMEPEAMQIMVEDYVMYLKKSKTANSFTVPISAIRAFLDCNDIDLRWKKIKRLMPGRIKKTGGEAWTTDEIAKMLSFTTEIRTKALVHFLASSGIRVGALEDLQMRHIKQIENCKSILVYEGSTEEYVTFLTREASDVLDDYIVQRESDGEKIESTSPMFRSTYQLGYAKAEPWSTSAIKESMRRLVLKSRLRDTQVKIGSRYNKQMDHGMRKRFNTILKTCHGANISLVERLMGHSVTVALDNVYLDPTIEQLFAEYKKAIPLLTIDGTARKDAELQHERAERSELEKKINEIKELKQKMNSFEKLKQELRDEFKEEIKNLNLQSK